MPGYCGWTRAGWRVWELRCRCKSEAGCRRELAKCLDQDERGVPVTKVVLPDGELPQGPVELTQGEVDG